jgi:hypothetical protein
MIFSLHILEGVVVSLDMKARLKSVEIESNLMRTELLLEYELETAIK